MNEDSGILGKTLLGLIVAGIVFAWAFPIAWITLAASGEDPVDQMLSATGLGPAEPFEVAGHTWLIRESTWIEVGDHWRARIVVQGKGEADSVKTGTMFALCDHLLATREGVPFGTARDAVPYRVDIAFPVGPEVTPQDVYPFAVINGRCDTNRPPPSSGLPLPPPLAGWAASTAFQQEVSGAQVQFFYQSQARHDGTVYRRHAIVGPVYSADAARIDPANPDIEQLALACGMLLSETDFNMQGEIEGLGVVAQTTPRELAITLANSMNVHPEDLEEAVLFRTQSTRCVEK